MSAKLLFITSHYFRQPTMDALGRMNLDCETKVIPYDNFRNIAEIYGAHAGQYDACFVSGMIAQQAIEQVYPNHKKPLRFYQSSINSLHRDILQVILETGEMDLSRIAMDFLLAIDEGYSVADFLKVEDFEEIYQHNVDQANERDFRRGDTIEDLVLNRIIALWERKDIDFVICQYSSIVPELQARGIPCRCTFLADHQLERLIREELVRLELQKLHDNHPTIIQIFPKQNTGISPEQHRRLGQSVHQFVKDKLIDCVVQETEQCCTLITSVKMLRLLTDEFRVCRLTPWLEERMGLPVLVGYGVGTSVSHAMNNVQMASKEAKLVGKPFIVDSQGCLIGPLNSDKHMVQTPESMADISSIARKCSLSSMTIQKVVTILQNMGSDRLTTQELATRLDTTLRNANRIMQNLCKGGVATPVYTQATHSRGRPIQVYALDFDGNE